MSRSRNRTRDPSLSAMPRLGFLLFILALAIVIWPRLRPTPAITASSDTHSETIPLAETLNVSHTTTVSQQSPSEQTQSEQSLPEQTPQTPGESDSSSTASKSNSVPSNSTQYADELIIADGQTRDLLSLVADNTTRMTKREMPAYWELVRRSSKATFSALRESASTKIKFRDLYNRPSKHRGELVGLDVTIRRVIRYDAEAGNSAGAKNVYEIWGSTDESQTWLYAFITDTLPDGFNEETLVYRKAEFAGYFFKLMAYQPGNAAPNAKPLLAPLLIGRFSSIGSAVQESKSQESSSWPSFGLASLIVFVAAYLSFRVFWKNKESKSKPSVQPKINLDDFE